MPIVIFFTWLSNVLPGMEKKISRWFNRNHLHPIDKPLVTPIRWRYGIGRVATNASSSSLHAFICIIVNFNPLIPSVNLHNSICISFEFLALKLSYLGILRTPRSECQSGHPSVCKRMRRSSLRLDLSPFLSTLSTRPSTAQWGSLNIK